MVTVRREGIPVLLLLFVLFPFQETLAGTKLASHRAYYSAAIGEVKNTSQIVDANGGMVMELTESCEGWESVQGTRLVLLNSRGDEFLADVHYTSWESRDGLQFHFNYVHRSNGQIQEELLGRATFPARGEAGRVTFSKPSKTSLALPASVRFPTEHLLGLLEQAEAGTQIYEAPLYDGTKVDGLYDVNAFIGKPFIAKPAEGEASLGRLAGERGWPMRLAYFPFGTGDAVPEVEISIRLLESGIAERMVFDHGDFTIIGTLERIDWLPQPDC
ncbi:MAG: DUF1849 family protein [Alphaproteobacteria bacterium]|nr:DUF1849 family protein [Alphaproteobacteria bacterium]